MKIQDSELQNPIIRYATQEISTLRADQTVAQVLDQLRTQLVGEKIVYFYVLDANDRLVGVMPTRRLLMSGPDELISAIMLKKVIAIPYLATAMEACEWFIQYRFLAFPIIDESHHLMGVVDISMFTDELIEVSERHSTEDVFQLLGLQIANLRTASAGQMFRGRFPWLMCNIVGGLSCAFLSSQYEQFLNSAIVLALFIPIVLALSESVGMQSMTITLQRLHGAEFNWREVCRSLFQEFFVAILLGVACGATVGTVAWLWKGEGAVALAIGCSIALSVVTACLLGVLLPSFVHALKVDPKIAAGPIVLATADLATLLFYFTVSMELLRRAAGT